MSWGAEGIPRDVEPAGGGQELVGVRAGAKKVDKTLELLRVLGADVGGLTKEVLHGGLVVGILAEIKKLA